MTRRVTTRVLAWMATIAGGCTGPSAPGQPVESAPAAAPAVESPKGSTLPPQPGEVPPEEVVAEAPIGLEFAPVIEGPCPDLGVSLTDGQAFAFYSMSEIFRVLPSGDLEDMSFEATGTEGVLQWAEIGRIEAIEGFGPHGLWARYNEVHGRVWEDSRYLRRRDGRWEPLERQGEQAPKSGVRALFPWQDGQLLGEKSCNGDEDCHDRGMTLEVVRGPGKAPRFPELAGDKEKACWPRFVVTALPSGEIFAVGRFCRPKDGEDGAWLGVRWTPQGGTTIERMPAQFDPYQLGPLVAASPTQVFLATSREVRRASSTTVVAFDGERWTLRPSVDGRPTALDVDREGRPWLVAGGRLVRGTADGLWEGVAFPTGPVGKVGGLRDPVGWVAQVDGALWLRRAGEEFARATLPPPAFSAGASYRATEVRSAGREVWVLAKYEEPGVGKAKTERRAALLRNAPVATTQRCERQEFSDRLVGWPAAAREGCATPFAVLLRMSSSAPKDFKYPDLGKLLKGRQELAGARFAEVEFGWQRIVGAAVPDLATGRALVELVAGGIKGARPELVCAAPEVKRPLPFDLATGALAP